MNLSFRIAKRYFFSQKKRSFISIIAGIAMLGVGIGTMAMVVVLSVFNGMEELNRMIFKTFDADITITPTEGRRFELEPATLDQLKALPNVAYVTKVIEDNALLRYNDRQMIIRLRGVDETYQKRGQLDSVLISGSTAIYGTNKDGFALLADGVRSALLISSADTYIPLEIIYPKNDRRILDFTSPDAFAQMMIRPGGVFFIESRYDDYVFAPLERVAELLQYGTKVSSIEIALTSEDASDQVKKKISQLLGKDFQVKDRDELNADLLRAIRVEKLFVGITLIIIILVAAINIFFSLSMLAIEKKNDVAILFAMGATKNLVKKLFLYEGTIIALTGAIVGLTLGILICYLQEKYGWVSMGIESALVEAYPVKIVWSDLFITSSSIILITVLVAYLPAYRATKNSGIPQKVL
jgi:lipoprotein-releasing system permease protein